VTARWPRRPGSARSARWPGLADVGFDRASSLGP
jgi:hypothetical protein